MFSCFGYVFRCLLCGCFVVGGQSEISSRLGCFLWDL